MTSGHTDLFPAALPSPTASVQRRLLVATLLVALVAVLVTAAVALGTMRAVEVGAARATLGAQAEAIAAARPLVRADLIKNLSDVDGQWVAVISAKGVAKGSGADLADPRVVAGVGAGRPVSTVVRSDGHNYLVEARPTSQGGGVLVAQDAATVRAFTPALFVRILLALTLGLVAAAIAAVLVTRSLARPMARLAERARRLAGGERGVAGTASGLTEIDNVDVALDSLDASLAHSEGRQREFLLSVSHEIRTPLTTIRGYAEAMQDGVTSPAEMADIGRILQSEVARLTSFTEDLLALSRLEADDFALNLVDGVDVGAVLAASAEAWHARAAAVAVTVVGSVDAGTAPIRTDPVRLRQVVDGLVDNALRVSPQGGSITLVARARSGGGVVVEVRDAGPGLTADDAAHAFQCGVLHARYQENRPVGSGLGLSIAARLVDRLGGTIEAVPSTTGAIFRIGLPPAP